MGKANYKKITASEITFLKPNEMEEGQEVEGRYIDAKKDQFGGLGYKFETENGTVVVNGTGQLDSLMAKIEPGTQVKLVYEGTSKLKSGKHKGKDAHQFAVYAEDTSEAL